VVKTLIKISVSWSRSRSIPKSNQLVTVTHPTSPKKVHHNSSTTFWVILSTDRQTSRHSETGTSYLCPLFTL